MSLLAPRIEMAFANKQIVFDDNPLMRWYTQTYWLLLRVMAIRFMKRKSQFVEKLMDSSVLYMLFIELMKYKK